MTSFAILLALVAFDPTATMGNGPGGTVIPEAGNQAAYSRTAEGVTTRPSAGTNMERHTRPGNVWAAEFWRSLPASSSPAA